MATSLYECAKSIYRAGRRCFQADPNRYLKHIKGIIHVGANVGQERTTYAKHDLNVVWIEPIPEVFERLKANLREFPKQRACNYVATDKDGELVTLHVASNDGGSSSILPLERHQEMWPDVVYDRDIILKSITLASLVEQENIDMRQYDALLMDTQGSELLVLKGAVPLLSRFRYVKTEVADFASYQGCCLVGEMNAFLSQHGFSQYHKQKIAYRAGIGSYYDIVYRNRSKPTG
jgi:FkbM family methyltransferase